MHSFQGPCEDRTHRSIRHWRDELQRRATGRKPADRTGKVIAQTTDLADTTAGQDRHGRTLFVQAQLPTSSARFGVFRNHIGERMADELGANAGPRVELLFERQQAQYQIDGCADPAHAPRAPGPDLRTHILHGAKSRSSQIARQPEIEFRRIDPDEDIRTLREQSFAQLSAHLQQPRQVTQHLEKPHDRESLRVRPGFATLRLHLRTRHAKESCRRIACAQRTDQRRAELVT